MNENTSIETTEIVSEIINNPIASILTLSLREILNYFKESIVRLKAKGGEFLQNNLVLDEPCGITYSTGSNRTIEMDYEQKRDTRGNVLNPLNDGKILEIFTYLDNNLPEFEDETGKLHPPDIPVELLIIEIEDDSIKEKAKTETNTFDAKFISEKYENDNLKDDLYKANKDLQVFPQGFKLRSLNLIELIERTQKYGLPKDDWTPIVQWGGFAIQDLSPTSPKEITLRIRDYHLPKDYAKLKTYFISKENRLQLDGYK